MNYNCCILLCIISTHIFCPNFQDIFLNLCSLLFDDFFVILRQIFKRTNQHSLYFITSPLFVPCPLCSGFCSHHSRNCPLQPGSFHFLTTFSSVFLLHRWLPFRYFHWLLFLFTFFYDCVHQGPNMTLSFSSSIHWFCIPHQTLC